MNKYIISNTQFNSKAAAKELGLSVDDYNEMLIKNWNSVVGETDEVMVFGQFGIGKRSSLREILSRLNGSNITMFNHSANKILTMEEWIGLGFSYSWDVNLKSEKVFIPIDISDSRPNFITAIHSGRTEVSDGKSFSIEAKFWDYTPFPLADLDEIAERIVDFKEEDLIES